MRFASALTLLSLLALPSLASAQTPPLVVVGPPASAPVTVPPGYEVEGELGGIHFRAQVTTPAPVAPAPVAPAPVAPAPVAPAPVAPAPPPAQIVVPAPQPVPVMVVQPAPPVVQQTQVQYAPAPAPQLAGMRDDALPPLDTGMDFGARLGLDLVGATLGFGLGTGLAYAVSDGNSRDDVFAPTLMMSAAGLVPTGISIFGGAIAGGRGRYGGALLGELIGGGLSATIVFAADLAPNDTWELIGAIMGPAVLGAIIGFECQHALRTQRLEERLEQQGARLTGLSVAPTSQRDGVLVGLSGTF